jgi:hypothetical protein
MAGIPKPKTIAAAKIIPLTKRGMRDLIRCLADVAGRVKRDEWFGPLSVGPTVSSRGVTSLYFR